MQVEAIIESVFKLKEEGIQCKPEIMIPLVSTVEEFTTLKENLVKTITQIEKQHRKRRLFNGNNDRNASCMSYFRRISKTL